MEYLIRKAIANDVEGVAYVHATSWHETYQGLINYEYLATRTIERSINVLSKGGLKDTYVATIDDKIVGFTMYCKCRDHDLSPEFGEVMSIYVLKDYQKLGIGKALIESAIKELRNQGYKKVSLWALNTNYKAIKFYERMGFVHDGTQKEDIMVTPIVEKRYLKTI